MKTQEEIEKLAEEWFENANTERWGGEVLGYIEGYFQCQEDNADKKYTEDDIYMALEFGRSHSSMTDKQFINSLNKQDK